MQSDCPTDVGTLASFTSQRRVLSLVRDIAAVSVIVVVIDHDGGDDESIELVVGYSDRNHILISSNSNLSG